MVWPMFVIVGLLTSVIASTISYEPIEVRLRNAIAALLGTHDRKIAADVQNAAAGDMRDHARS